MSETHKKQSDTWLLIAPDGRRFEAETPMKCAQQELHDRVPAKVALERLMAKADGNEMIEFNINNYCCVQLTDIGRDELKRQHDEFNRNMNGKIGEYKPIAEDDDGFSRWKMYTLMNTFGHMLSPGFVIPFMTTIRIDV